MDYAERPNYMKHVSYHVKNMSNDSVIFRFGSAHNKTMAEMTVALCLWSLKGL